MTASTAWSCSATAKLQVCPSSRRCRVPSAVLTCLPVSLASTDQISTELSDLIGGDFDPSFVTWLFDELKKHYPEPSATPAAPAPSAAAPSAASAPAASSSGSSLPARPAVGGRNMLGAALSGVKRDSREMGDREQPPHQKQRFDRDHPPLGPRGMSVVGPGGKSLFERVQGNNPQFAPGRNAGPVNTLGMPQAAFDAVRSIPSLPVHAFSVADSKTPTQITQTIQAVKQGAHPSALASIPFPALAAHPFASTLPPAILAQAQAHAMAQAEAFATMQNVWSSPAGAFPGGPGGPPGGFNPNAAPFNPAFGGPGAPNGLRGAPGSRPPAAKPATPPVVLPTKPEQEQICKHGVECTKPQCPFSHPSPVATKESGLVLSSEPCEKQLKCEDPVRPFCTSFFLAFHALTSCHGSQDCPKSHVSRAQKTHPPSSVSSGTTVVAGAAPRPRPIPAIADPMQIPGAGERPCKFAGACTRPGCVFLHPWDVRGDAAGGQMPCRYGAACTRADCHFSHPPNRPAPYSKSKYSATFNKSSPASKPATIGEWPKENASHVSERLKRFAAKDEDGAEKERIVPGQQEANGAADKVEIHLDDDEEKKDAAGKVAAATA
ncbi:SPOSA6832_00399, partial [Sporobolomyces salmonicolor]